MKNEKMNEKYMENPAIQASWDAKAGRPAKPSPFQIPRTIRKICPESFEVICVISAPPSTSSDFIKRN